MARRNRRGRYTVRAGDTVTTIAKQFGIDPQTLLQANTGVSNLRPGMVLKAPTPQPAESGPWLPPRSYQVPLAQYQPQTDYFIPPTGFVPPSGIDYRNRSATLPYGTTAPLGGRAEPAITGAGYYTPPAQPDYSRGYTPSPIDRREQYGAPAGVFSDRGGRPGLSTAGMMPTEARAAADTAGGGGGNYIPYDAGQSILRGYGTAGRTNMAHLAELARQSYGIVNWEAADGSIYKVKVRDFGGGDIRFTPVSSSTQTQGRLGFGQPTKGQRNRFGSPVTTDKQYYGRTGGEGEVTYEDWYSAERGTKYGVKSGKGKKWSNSSMRTYDEWLGKQEATTASDADFENWVNQITGWYSEDIWTEAKTTYPPAEEPDLPPGQEPAIYDYTVWAKAAFDRYNELEKSDTKRGFYDWYQENQYIFGSAAWDQSMGKTVDGSYDTDKAKTAYAAYLGYEPTWEEPEFGGAAHAPRYSPGQYFDYDSRGGYTPMQRTYARPNYLGLINWRI